VGNGLMVNGCGVVLLADVIFTEEKQVTVPAPTYDDLASLLSAYGDAFAPSECHGMLCAMASCQPDLDGETWARRMLSGEVEALLEGESLLAGGVDANDTGMLKALFDDSIKQLDDPELGFQLLLPDEETPLQERTRALAAWCQGFLYGLSLGGVKEFGVFSEPVQEFARDLVEIARLEHNEGDDDVGGETAFFDIGEYVRMGVLMLRDELLDMAARMQPSGDEPGKVVLH
jgi:uncharacterized protein YgfB (UPF0149 family)